MDFLPGGCRNLVYTDHSEPPSRSPLEETTCETSVWVRCLYKNHHKTVYYWSCSNDVAAYLAGAGGAGVSVGAARQITLTTNTLRKISVSKCTTITLSTYKALLTSTLTRRHTWTYKQQTYTCWVRLEKIMKYHKNNSNNNTALTLLCVVSDTDWWLWSSEVTVTLNTWRIRGWRHLHTDTDGQRYSNANKHNTHYSFIVVLCLFSCRHLVIFRDKSLTVNEM